MRLVQIITDAIWHWRLPASHKVRIRAARDHLRAIQPLAASDEPQDARALFYRLRGLDPLVFEELVLECLSRRGNRVRRNRRYSGDGGADGRIWHLEKWCPIQVKRYRGHIDPAHVEALADLARQWHAPAAWFVHTGRTGPKARRTCQGAEIRMISGDVLRRMIAGA